MGGCGRGSDPPSVSCHMLGGGSGPPKLLRHALGRGWWLSLDVHPPYRAMCIRYWWTFKEKSNNLDSLNSLSLRASPRLLTPSAP